MDWALIFTLLGTIHTLQDTGWRYQDKATCEWAARTKSWAGDESVYALCEPRIPLEKPSWKGSAKMDDGVSIFMIFVDDDCALETKDGWEIMGYPCGRKLPETP